MLVDLNILFTGAGGPVTPRDVAVDLAGSRVYRLLAKRPTAWFGRGIRDLQSTPAAAS